MTDSKLCRADTITRRDAIAGAAALSVAVAASSLATAKPAFGNSGEELNVAMTKAGKVRGKLVDGTYCFRGIRYGATTEGMRFRPPRPPVAWKGVSAASEFPAQSPQIDFSLSGNSLFTALAANLTPSEDCLFLGVWTPGLRDGKKRPVLVWLHGGGFVAGSGSVPVYDGQHLSKRGDVVVVTVTHRLGVYGYLYLGDRGGESFADSGNAGTLDQILALKWVKDNITEFGGDPENVTIFGESGGGAKVSILLATPSAEGLFHKAIVQSGSALTVSSRRRATGLADQVLGALGIKSTQIDRLSAMSMQDLSFAVQTAADSSQLNVLGLGPVLDGRTLPHEPWVPAAPGLSRNVPMMIGTVKDEATSISAPNDPMLFNMDESGLRTRVSAMIGVEHFDAALAAARKVYPFASPSDTYFTLATWTIMRSNAIIQAERKLAQGSVPVHMYLLAWETPVDDGRWKVPHGLDLPLVFDNVAGSPMMLGTGGQAQRVADAMSFAWIEFARNGNPGWAPYDAEKRETMVFTASSTVVSDPESAVRQVFAKIPAKNL